MDAQRFKALDGIRGIAAIIVAFFWHYKSFFQTDNPPFYSFGYWGYNYGWIMVDLFFILSGFVFFSVYGQPIREHTITIKEFIVLRFSRLYPLHLVTLCVVLVFKIMQKVLNNIYMHTGYRYSILDIFINIPMAQNGWLTTRFSFNAPSWSISVEIMMYLLFFYIFYTTGKTKKYLVYTCIMIYAGLILYTSGWNIGFFNGQTARGLIGFFIGIITAEMYYYCKNNGKHKNKFLLLCGLGILGTTVIPIVFGYRIIPSWSLITIFVLFPSLIIVAVYSKTFSNVLSVKPLRYFGDISYSMYLLHYPVVLLVRNVPLSLDYSSKIFFIGYFALVIGVSHISHYYFEKPLQNYIRKISGLYANQPRKPAQGVSKSR